MTAKTILLHTQCKPLFDGLSSIFTDTFGYEVDGRSFTAQVAGLELVGFSMHKPLGIGARAGFYPITHGSKTPISALTGPLANKHLSKLIKAAVACEGYTGYRFTQAALSTTWGELVLSGSSLVPMWPLVWEPVRPEIHQTNASEGAGLQMPSSAVAPVLTFTLVGGDAEACHEVIGGYVSTSTCFGDMTPIPDGVDRPYTGTYVSQFREQLGLTSEFLNSYESVFVEGVAQVLLAVFLFVVLIWMIFRSSRFINLYRITSLQPVAVKDSLRKETSHSVAYGYSKRFQGVEFPTYNTRPPSTNFRTSSTGSTSLRYPRVEVDF